MAMAILEKMGLDWEQSKEWLTKRYWELTRVPEPLYLHLTENIVAHGLCGGSVRLHAADWSCGDSLVMLQWHPPNGWVHLLNETGRRLRQIDEYPYHISICYLRDIWSEWHWKRWILYQLWDLYKENVVMNIAVSWWGRGGSIHLSKSGILYQQLFELWSTGHESYKSGLHISL